MQKAVFLLGKNEDKTQLLRNPSSWASRPELEWKGKAWQDTHTGREQPQPIGRHTMAQRMQQDFLPAYVIAAAYMPTVSIHAFLPISQCLKASESHYAVNTQKVSPWNGLCTWHSEITCCQCTVTNAKVILLNVVKATHYIRQWN